METDTQDSNGGLEFRWVQTLQLRMFYSLQMTV